jgi:hypothetical protein
MSEWGPLSAFTFSGLRAGVEWLDIEVAKVEIEVLGVLRGEEDNIVALNGNARAENGDMRVSEAEVETGEVCARVIGEAWGLV